VEFLYPESLKCPTRGDAEYFVEIAEPLALA
jgi:hypothetical protein